MQQFSDLSLEFCYCCRARYKLKRSRPDLQSLEVLKPEASSSGSESGTDSGGQLRNRSDGGVMIMGEDAVMGSDVFLHSVEVSSQ